MRDKWNKQDAPQQTETEGQPVGQRIALFPEMYRPKLFTKAPSMKAINTYNSIATDNFHTYDNLSYTPCGSDLAVEYKPPLTPASMTNSYDYATTLSVNSNSNSVNDTNSMYMHTLDNRGGIIYTTSDGIYDYPTLRSTTSMGDNQSEASESRKEDQGSTSRLVSPKAPASCWSCFTYAETVLCTISLAVGLGNLYRLPQTALIRGGLPFLVAYIILSLLIGLPLLFLELGLGQLSQEGFTKTWRAVPLFRGVGYVKFIAVCLLSLYYPLYMGLFANYLIWLGKGPPPFSECASVKITESGYKAAGIPGQECLQKTFLESPFSDPKWYGIYAGLLLLIWIIIILLLIGRTKAYVKSLTILLLPTVGCLIALIVKAVEMENKYEGLEKFTEDIDWSLLSSANIWYYAVIQVFFSTNIGFGSFVTNAGIIFSKVNAFWTALGYVLVNIIVGIISVILCFTLSGDLHPTNTTGNTAELHLLSLIYDSGREHSNSEAQIWIIVAYTMLLISGFISMITIVYTLLKAIRVETKQKWSWWQTTLVLSFIGFILGAIILLPSNFVIVHLLDHYVVGNLILICTVLEVLAIVAFYGSKRIQLDFEFILGKSLSKLWIGFWWLVPIILAALFIWALSTLPLSGIWIKDPDWLYGTGWAIVLTALIFIIAMACYQVFNQDEYYTFNDKMVAVTKPLRKWGPVDPIMRYSWVQWHSKAKNGERDFTLKRRGTRDYTHSVKKRREPYGKTYVSTISDSSTLSRGSPSSYDKNDHNQNNISPVITSNYGEPLRIQVNSPYPSQHSRIYSDSSNQYEKPLRVTSIVDTLDPPDVYSAYLNKRNTYPNADYKANINPLSLPVPINTFGDMQNESSTSEGYGTFRKGPYIIPDDNVAHVCHRKYSEPEISTEL